MPLPRQAVELLRTLHPQTGRGVAGLVFPSVRSVARPLSENTMNAMLRRLGFSQNDMTSHGFRSIFSTFSNESGLWSRDAIERQLAHQDPDEVRRAYSRGSHWQERIRLMQWWADKLDAMRVGATVLHLDKARG